MIYNSKKVFIIAISFNYSSAKNENSKKNILNIRPPTGSAFYNLCG